MKINKRRWLIVGAAWAWAAIAISPILLHWTPPSPTKLASVIAIVLALLAGLLLCFQLYLLESKRSNTSQATSTILFVLLITIFCFYAHYFLVDNGYYFPLPLSNASWQAQLHDSVIRLDVGALPHSYRFLPNAIVLWMQMFRVHFSVASGIFRVLTGLVFFYALYRYARIYTNHLGGLIAMMLVGLVYPVSFVGYAGQLTDPLSHLSFLIAFISLEIGEFPFFVTALLIGSLAKETVLGMLGYYVLFFRKDKNYALKAVVLCVTCLAAYFGVRMFVLHGAVHYQQVSGVNREFIVANLLVTKIWPVHFAVTALAYLPFLFLGWRTTPMSLKKLTLYLLPLLFISNLLFSWLNEARNYMPLVFVLAVVAARYLVSHPAEPQDKPLES